MHHRDFRIAYKAQAILYFAGVPLKQTCLSECFLAPPPRSKGGTSGDKLCPPSDHRKQ